MDISLHDIKEKSALIIITTIYRQNTKNVNSRNVVNHIKYSKFH